MDSDFNKFKRQKKIIFTYPRKSGISGMSVILTYSLKKLYMTMRVLYIENLSMKGRSMGNSDNLYN